MRAAFLSDIHGNVHALAAVQRFLLTQNIDHVLVLGDLVGYGASPGAVIDTVERMGWQTTLGSSDARVAFGFVDKSERTGVSDTVLGWTREMLTREQTDFLRRLPTSGRLLTPLGRVRFFHGSPHDPDKKLNLLADDRELEQVQQTVGAKFVVCGGTHVPFYRKVGEGLFIDPGSVGLTLNSEPGADVTVVDFSGRMPSVEMHKVQYDFHAAAFDIMAWDLPPVIADVIRTGRMG